MENVVTMSGPQYRALLRVLDKRISKGPKYVWYDDGSVYASTARGVYVKYTFDKKPFEGRFMLPPLPTGVGRTTSLDTYHIYRDFIEVCGPDGKPKAEMPVIEWKEYSLYELKFSPKSAVPTSMAVTVESPAKYRMIEVIEAFCTKSMKIGTLKLDGVDTVMVSGENDIEPKAILTMMVQGVRNKHELQRS